MLFVSTPVFVKALILVRNVDHSIWFFELGSPNAFFVSPVMSRLFENFKTPFPSLFTPNSHRMIVSLL